MPTKKQTKNIIEILLIILILFFALRLLIPSLNSPSVKRFVTELGVYGPLVIITYTIISHIFAPLAGTPGILLSLALYGMIKTRIYLYLASLISASINFYIARRFGRRWVIKLAGKKSINQVDNFVKASGAKVLILSRIFGFSIFEIISYAAGLTNISFKKYFLITAVFNLIPSVALTYFFQDMDFTSAKTLALWITTIITTGVIFSVFLKKYIDKQK